MNNLELYEVSRFEYKSFVQRIICGMGIAEEKEYEERIEYSLSSKRTGVLWCKRVSHKDETIGEKYYIINYPEEDEWTEPVARQKVVLETPEQVQMLLDGLKKMRKQNGN